MTNTHTTTTTQAIDNANTAEAAVNMTDHEARRDYIMVKENRQTLNRNFTRAMIIEKFVQVWTEENGK